MAATVKVRRIANPRHRARHMTPKQIRFFGTKRQKAALKAKRQRTNHRATRRNESVEMGFWRGGKFHPIRASSDYGPEAVGERHQYHAKKKTKKKKNALVVTLGSMNPKRRNMPATKKNKRRRQANVRHRPRHAKNTHHFAKKHRTRTIRAAAPKARRNKRRSNVRHYARNRSRTNTRIIMMKPNRRPRRKNPTELFGAPLFSKPGLEMLGGGFLGLVAAKFIPTLLPASITGGIASSSIGRVIISGISAVVAGWLGAKVSVQFGQGILFGGMVQTFSVALNWLLPGVYAGLNPSLGDLTPGSFPVPMNPILAGRPMATLPPAAAAVAASGGGGQVRMANTSGLGRAYGPAY